MGASSSGQIRYEGCEQHRLEFKLVVISAPNDLLAEILLDSSEKKVVGRCYLVGIDKGPHFDPFAISDALTGASDLLRRDSRHRGTQDRYQALGGIHHCKTACGYTTCR